MRSLRIAYVVSEAEGLVKSGGLADVAKALPKALSELEQEVVILLPAYQSIDGIDKADILLSSKLDHWPYSEYLVRKLWLDGVLVYAIDSPQYFARQELYAENNRAYSDNGERFAFFSAAVLDCLPKLNRATDILHCNDWHTGLIPYLLNHRYQSHPFYQDTYTVMTIHNANFQGIFHYDDLANIPELKRDRFAELEYENGYIGTLKAGIAYADKINAVSPNYAVELLTPLGSHGLYDDFSKRRDDLTGILNGCDYSEWNPATDRYLTTRYNATLSSMQKGKATAKSALQEMCGLPVKETPVFGMVCRLSEQKGFDYLLPIIERFLYNDVQLVIIGTGDPVIANTLHSIASRHGDKFFFKPMYSNKIAHYIEAGSDFFLMPSQFEACGLNQIYSMAYGTLPIVREVGGLKDTVVDYDTDPENATGFSFSQPDAQALLLTMQRALIFYLQSPKIKQQLQLRSMKKEFSWKESAKQYIDTYISAMTKAEGASGT